MIWPHVQGDANSFQIYTLAADRVEVNTDTILHEWTARLTGRSSGWLQEPAAELLWAYGG